jgi:hypothetical protein
MGMSEQSLPDTTCATACDKPKKEIPTRSKVHMQALYASTRKCNATTKEGKKCKAIALEGCDYCRQHATVAPLQKLKAQADRPAPGYNYIDLDNREFRKEYENFFNSNTLIGVRDEIALLKAYLSMMLKYPSYNKGCIPLQELQVQTEVIKTIRGLCLAAKKMEIQDKYFGKANDSIKQVVTQMVLIIDKFVTDGHLKSVLANEIFKLGKREDQPAGVVDMDKVDTDKFLNSSSTEKKEMVDNTKVDTLGPEQLKKESESNFATIQSFTRDRASAELCNA